jgi:hypothetical protein
MFEHLVANIVISEYNSVIQPSLKIIDFNITVNKHTLINGIPCGDRTGSNTWPAVTKLQLVMTKG